MNGDADKNLRYAVNTIELAGLRCDVKRSYHETKDGNDGVTFSININGGVRPVSVWPINGTVFASAVRNKKSEGGGWKYKTPVNLKHLTFEQSVYMAVQVALGELI